MGNDKYCETSLISHVYRVHTTRNWKQYFCSICSNKTKDPFKNISKFRYFVNVARHVVEKHWAHKTKPKKELSDFIMLNVKYLPLYPSGFRIDPVPKELYRIV